MLGLEENVPQTVIARFVSNGGAHLVLFAMPSEFDTLVLQSLEYS